MSSSPSKAASARNIFTVDLEEWFHANYHSGVFDDHATYEVRVVRNTQRLLALLGENRAKATFFVLGSVAEAHPALLREIADAGHELATHGHAHRLVYEQTPDEFRQDVARAKAAVESITGRHVKGYRAPSWSIDERSLWALEVLEELGFAYDSSVFPIKTYLYGMPSAPRFTYRPTVGDRSLDILEVPASTVRLLGRNLPFSGGFYFRSVPFWMFARCVRSMNREGQPTIAYLHPREIDPVQPHLPLSFKEGLIHYYGVRGCERKLVRALQSFVFTSIEDCLGL